MKAFVLCALTLTGFQWGMAQQMMSFKPGTPVICYQGSANRHDHVGVSDKFRQGKQDRGARTKSATFQVEYRNFPADNLAKAAVQYAVSIWESELISSVPVRIIAEWKPLDAGVLGQALWGRAYANFGGEQHINTYYPVALAEKIAGRDLNDETEEDIVASFNSNSSWYFGTDGNTPEGRMDMVTIALHEIAHGLGFTDTYDVENSEGSVGLENGSTSIPFIFDVFVENQSAENLLQDFQSPSAELAAALQSTNLFFNGALSLEALSGTRPELFAPAAFNSGSSISHLDEGVFSAAGDPNRLMTPHIDFAESIHDPGGVLRGMLGDIGWIYTNLDHEPLRDTERADGLPYPVTVSVRSDNGYDNSKVKLHYTTDGINFTVVDMAPTGFADQFEASLPGTTSTLAYGYFISVVDGAGRIFTNPGKVQTPGAQAEQGTHFFSIGPDLAAPEITHDPVTYILETDNQLVLNVEVTDNLGVKDVVVEYTLNGGALQTAPMASVGGTDQYTASISLPSLNVGDALQYRIVAGDLATVENIAFHPAEGFHSVAVNGILPAQDSYINNFNGPSGDFFGNSFSITTPQGFANGAIHSEHPYSNGTGVNEESHYIYQLQIPIRVATSDAVMKFEEIVLVEPGEDGSVFGDPDFFDYAVVEGSADGGVTWLEFSPGYDSRDNSAWLTRYHEAVVSDNSESVADSSLYRLRVIDLLENQNFQAGDEVLIRFRLFADALAHGWGWAIDDLSIQGPVTGLEEPLSKTFKVYPVPASADLFLEMQVDTDEPVAIQLSDLQGRILYEERSREISNGMLRATIDITSFKEGLYFLKATSGKHLYIRKFFKTGR